MNARLTKNRIRTLAAAAMIVGGAVLVPAVGTAVAQPERVVPTVAQDLVDSAALAAFARAHGLTGLSPASLRPMPGACRGLSPASAQDCPAEMIVVATGGA